MPKPKKEYITIIECPRCHEPEYYGMMFWRDNRMVCRRCFKKLTKNGVDIQNFFPLFEDGIDYTKPQEEENPNAS